ncbi:hypothetical protein LZ32DRAFT_284918 [Colletotrichum eremochloae]|nr:hypothetical protein LZ32DRAFT_284918 [Colletotrichum eremochloae]
MVRRRRNARQGKASYSPCNGWKRYPGACLPASLTCRIRYKEAPPNHGTTPHPALDRALVVDQAYLCSPKLWPFRFIHEGMQLGERIQKPVPLECDPHIDAGCLKKKKKMLVGERPLAGRVTRKRLGLSLQVDKQRQAVMSGGSNSTATSSGNNIGLHLCSE